MTFVIIFNSCPDLVTAKRIADALVDANLAACVHILPAGFSVYRWQGQIESAEEHLLSIKTHEDQYPKIETMIQKHHPYELPEIIAVPITSGLPDYLNWLHTEIQNDK